MLKWKCKIARTQCGLILCECKVNNRRLLCFSSSKCRIRQIKCICGTHACTHTRSHNQNIWFWHDKIGPTAKCWTPKENPHFALLSFFIFIFCLFSSFILFPMHFYRARLASTAFVFIFILTMFQQRPMKKCRFHLRVAHIDVICIGTNVSLVSMSSTMNREMCACEAKQDKRIAYRSLTLWIRAIRENIKTK